MVNIATWMTDNSSFQNLTIAKLVLPGTHDSASYSLLPTLSQINYENISILWNLQSTTAPANGVAPWANPVSPGNNLYPLSGKSMYVGPVMYDFIMSIMQNVSQTQGSSLCQQLSAGIRYLDLRVYYDSNIGTFAVQHGLRGCTLTSALMSIQEYITANPISKELIVIEISHANYGGDQTLINSFMTILTQYLSDYLLMPTGASDPFQALALNSLSSITNRQINGVKNTYPTFIVLNTDKFIYPSPVFNSPGYATAAGSNAVGTDSVTQLTSIQQAGISENPADTLYRVAWTLTPQVNDAITQVLNQLSGASLPNEPSGTTIMQYLATLANVALPGFLNNNWLGNFNCISVDWYELGASQTVVDLAITANNERVSANV